MCAQEPPSLTPKPFVIASLNEGVISLTWQAVDAPRVFDIPRGASGLE